MGKILRKLTIHKRLVQKNSDVERVSGNYRCFGEVDGFEISGCLKDIDLWEDSIKRLKLGYHDQPFYIVRWESEDDKKDSEFWSESACKQPHVMLVSFIRMSSNMSDMSWMNIIENIEKAYDDVKGYCTLEQSDFILFIRGESYAQCDSRINDIRNKSFGENISGISYSYSIPAIMTDVFEDDNQIAEYDEPLDKVEILISAKSNGELSKNVKKFADELIVFVESCEGSGEIASRFGNYDIQVVLRNIRMCDLLALHKEGNPLCHTNEVYKRTVYKCITKIHVMEKRLPEEEDGISRKEHKPCKNIG